MKYSLCAICTTWIVLLLQETLRQTVKITVLQPPILKQIFPDGFDARILMWRKQSTFQSLEIRLREAAPYDGYEPYSYDTPKTPTGYIVNGLNKCPLSTLIHNAQAKNAKALIIIYHEETDISNAVEHSHLPAVRIHVIPINKKDGMRIRDAVDAEKLSETTISINFLSPIQNANGVNLEIVYSPDDPSMANFFAEYSTHRLATDASVSIMRKYTMLHCSSCAEQGFTMAKENCLSGGRYCMKSTTDEGITGEVMLVQTLKNICAEKTLLSNNRKGILKYY